MAPRNKYALTEEQFGELLKHLHERPVRAGRQFYPSNIEAARAVMVGGRHVLEVAGEHQCTKQHLYRIIRDLWAVYQDNQVKIPDDWRRIAVTLPPDLAESVEQMETEAKAQLWEQQKG